MTAELFKQIEQHGACVDLSSRAKFLLTGADRVRYLNGQVTNDVRKASTGEAIYACVTNAKGRMEADVFIHAADDGQALLLDAEEVLREPLGLRLDRYIVADDVELKDVTDQWRLWHFFGAAAQKLEAGSREQGVNSVKASRFGMAGIDVWVPVNAEYRMPNAEVLSATDLEIWRICAGIPRWPWELNGDTFPSEAALESKAMDFMKGCYIGQEVLSRIKTTGKMPRHLIRFRVRDSDLSDNKTPSPQSWKVAVQAENGAVREVGAVTSSCHHPFLDHWTGLAYVRSGVALADSVLLADSEPTRIFAQLEII